MRIKFEKVKKPRLYIQEWNCKKIIDKWVKNHNLKSKHWEHNFKYHQNLNWMVKLKRKNKFTKESKLKIKIKRMRTKLEEIKNQNYGSNDKIKNKLRFDKRVKNQI